MDVVAVKTAAFEHVHCHTLSAFVQFLMLVFPGDFDLIGVDVSGVSDVSTI